MITPAYSPTATERVLPRLALDFTTGVLDPRVTVVRALNTATRYNSSGYIEIVNANLPRFDYDPATRTPKGLLIEESRINIALQSQDFNTASWTKSNLTISAGAVTSPDGTANAYKLEETSATGIHAVTQGPTMALSTTYTLSVYAKAAERDWIALNIYSGTASNWTWFDVKNGAIGSATNNPPRSIQAVGNGWYRCAITVTTAASGTPNIAIFVANANGSISYAGTTGSGIYPYGAQLEAGAFATSYIPTTTTSLTRNADQVAMTGTNFSDWYNSSEGSFTVQFDSAAVSATDTKLYYALGASNGTASNLNGVYTYQAAAYGATVNGGAGQANISAGAVTVNTTQKVCYGYKVNSFAASLNGAAANLDGSGSIPTVDRLSIGALYGSTNVLNGHVAKLAFYPQRLTNAEVRAFSK